MANDGDAVVSLFEVSKRVGLRRRGSSNWTPLLKALCSKGGIEVRDDDSGVPCCLASSVPAIQDLVDRHFDRVSYSAGARRGGRI
jgi:hypothetical protein